MEELVYYVVYLSFMIIKGTIQRETKDRIHSLCGFPK